MKKLSKDKRVCFLENSHSYFLSDKKLISVTSLIEKFKNKFDSDFFSKKIALREGKTQQEILELWSEKAKKSCEIGTGIHLLFENYKNKNYAIVNEKLVFDDYELKNEYKLEYNQKKEISLKFINDFFETKRLIPLESEFIVYNDLIAGQIDMICKDNKGNFYIIDFKTNSSISDCSYGKKMNYLFSEFNDSNYYHYSIQLSIYKKILKEYPISKMYLIHITDKNYSFIRCIDVFEKINFDDLYQYI
jgi:ATP-dependent exoDNAse (exonuclease V) beta subunit